MTFSVVGRRGNSTMKFRGEDVRHSYVGFTDRPAFADAREISADLTSAYIDRSWTGSTWSTTATSRR